MPKEVKSEDIPESSKKAPRKKARKSKTVQSDEDEDEEEDAASTEKPDGIIKKESDPVEKKEPLEMAEKPLSNSPISTNPGSKRKAEDVKTEDAPVGKKGSGQFKSKVRNASHP